MDSEDSYIGDLTNLDWGSVIVVAVILVSRIRVHWSKLWYTIFACVLFWPHQPFLTKSCVTSLRMLRKDASVQLFLGFNAAKWVFFQLLWPMLLGLLKNVTRCVLDPSKVVHFWRIWYGWEHFWRVQAT